VPLHLEPVLCLLLDQRVEHESDPAVARVPDLALERVGMAVLYQEQVHAGVIDPGLFLMRADQQEELLDQRPQLYREEEKHDDLYPEVEALFLFQEQDHVQPPLVLAVAVLLVLIEMEYPQESVPA